MSSLVILGWELPQNMIRFMTNIKFSVTSTTLTPSMQHGKRNPMKKKNPNLKIIADEEC